MSGKTKELWVWAGTRESGRAGLNLCALGRQMAHMAGSRMIALLPEPADEELIARAAQSGAEEIVILRDTAGQSPSREGCAAALAERIRRSTPETLLLAADPEGRELAVRVAAELETGVAQDCTELTWSQEQGQILFTRPVQGGRQMAVQALTGPAPQIATIRPGIGGRREQNFDWPFPMVTTEQAALSGSAVKVRSIVQQLEQDRVDLEHAEIILSGGRGMGGPKGFDLLRRAAAVLGGQVGASRAAVDLGWISHAHQVGLTGTTVAPRLYIACGISGAMQHLAGMSGSERILAINRDPNAPIFQVADYVVEGDLFQILPALVEELEKRRR